ncbi:MAG TPA: FkbM family methyltransferase [Planctomycetota bacterium]|nr:FkbM family methyltransferase [Planctomycetota bacterium]
MREAIKFFLSRHPRLYERILRFKKRKEYDNERIVFLNAICDGDTVFDVGANRGIHTVLLSHLAGAKGSVHAFEPVPATFALLSARVAAQKRFDNVRLNNFALSDRDGTVTIHMPGNDDGQASMARHGAGSWAAAASVTSFDCKTVTLDAYVASIALEPDFIKCDVEGAELLVLRGGQGTLARQPVLFLEVCAEWTRNFGYTPRDVLNFVKPHGYDLFFLIDESGIRRVSNAGEALDEKNLSGSADLLCAVSALHGGRLKRLK